ncbi:hypothetical protein CLOSTMETH_00757 [[Clostridium] methylpentosum DSM 5476]|uniref:Uncharacterized protein n=1 Tax=[Clostridium] methylpentosum DSM 5476 TaxID=537013 RepID=C0EAA2_9FIRM|nr:hypothetical protein CLOSTMETH_00757 [[Clostridium] methylpentosum DSM 5476]
MENICCFCTTRYKICLVLHKYVHAHGFYFAIIKVRKNHRTDFDLKTNF